LVETKIEPLTRCDPTRRPVLRGLRHGDSLSAYNAFATSTAVSSCVSRPSFNASRASPMENFGTMPLFSSILPCHVRYAATGRPRMYPWPTLYALPLSRRPGVFVPTMVARLFSSAKAETISPALAVCSFTNSTTRSWNRCWPSPSVTTRIDFSTKAYRAANHMRVP